MVGLVLMCTGCLGFTDTQTTQTNQTQVEYSASSHCHAQRSAYAFDNSLEIFVNQLYKVANSCNVHWQRSEKNDRLHGSKKLEDRLELRPLFAQQYQLRYDHSRKYHQ